METARLRKRKVCVVTGSRADYGFLSNLMREIKKDHQLSLQVIATGMHVSKYFGSTYKNIERDGFHISEKVPVLMGLDSETDVTKAIGKGCLSFADVYKRVNPDIVVILGDRYEMLAPALAAHIRKIPIAHIHGGETSQGVIDEAIRHSITKMANIHFPATNAYRRRIIQLGENPKYVYNFGSPGLDTISHMKLLGRKDIERYLNFPLEGKVVMVTYHPVTLEKTDPRIRVKNLLKAIEATGIKAAITQTNADAKGKIINQELIKFCKKNPHKYRFVPNLGQRLYLSCLKEFDVMVGNSSSGLIEAPSFKLPVVNIGDRQKGRIKAKNVIDVGNSASEIKGGIRKALSPSFRKGLKNMRNPYDAKQDGKISFRIKQNLKKIKLNEKLFKKEFYENGWAK